MFYENHGVRDAELDSIFRGRGRLRALGVGLLGRGCPRGRGERVDMCQQGTLGRGGGVCGSRAGLGMVWGCIRCLFDSTGDASVD